jgi:hypothetical protein
MSRLKLKNNIKDITSVSEIIYDLNKSCILVKLNLSNINLNALFIFMIFIILKIKSISKKINTKNTLDGPTKLFGLNPKL